MKPRLLLARLCDLCDYSSKAGRANRFPRYYLLKNKLSDRMIKQLLNSVITKYRDLSMSRRSILATDKSRYFAQPRPIIANYLTAINRTLPNEQSKIPNKDERHTINNA